MEGMDYWRFCDELTVVQAACLLVGEDPAHLSDNVDNWGINDKPVGYVAVSSALKHSIVSNRLDATWVMRSLEYGHPDIDHPLNGMDWQSTRILVSDLKNWLTERGVQNGFFFPDGPIKADYLDTRNDAYAPKLAAAVEAWKAVRAERTAKASARSVKQDLTKWLNLHAAEYGLTNDEGEPNKQAIEEVAKVANWNPKGGAPKTPGEALSTLADELDPPF